MNNQVRRHSSAGRFSAARFSAGLLRFATAGVITVALFACWTANAFAQSAASGTITGSVTDPQNLVVPGATVVIHNTGTGIDRTLKSNEAGIYVATFLQPGYYEVRASKEGLAEVVRKDLTLQVGQTLTIDMALPLQSAQGTVTVTAETPLLDTDKTEASQQVSQTLVENLPIVGRRWDNFVLLTPGVTTDGGLVSYRGISGLYNNNTVDGANNNQAFFSEARGRSTVPYTYSEDSIREFQVSASDYSAEFGQAAGGVVNAVTKSGGNDFHADLFYYLRYPTFNALDSYGKSKGIYTQPVHQQQQFGGSAGGALIKDKLFYFLTYDGSRKVYPVAYTSTSTFPLPCPKQVTSAQCTAANNYLQAQVGSFPRTAVQDLAFGKLDYQMNAANHFSVNFDLDDFHSPDGYSAGSTYNNLSVTANGAAVTHTRFLVGNWDSTITPTILNSFRFQWGVDDEVIGANAAGPSVGISNVMTYGMPNALPRPAFPDEHRWQFSDTVSISQGRHTIKLGVDMNMIHELLINMYQGGGLYSYTGSAATAFGNWVADVYGVNLGDGKTGKHYASFAQVTDPITGVGKDDFWDNDAAAFVEDSFKVRPNLTINAGVRYEIQQVPQPPKPNTNTPLLTQYTSTINTAGTQFAPRIGIAWQPMKNTMVRAGYGMFYAKTSNSTYYAIRVENGIYQQTFNCGPTTSCAPIFPNLIFTPPGPAPSAPFAGALAPQVINTNPPLGVLATHGLAPDFVNPLVHEGEVSIERQLPGHLSLSATYLFSRALHLPVFLDVNVAPSTTTMSYDIMDASGNVAQTITEPFYTSRINPQTGVILNGYSVVNAWYNGLVVTFRRPMSHGVELLFNYTFSKSIDDGAVPGAYGTFYGTDDPLNPYNIKQENALSDLDQRHRFVGSAVFAPTWFHHVANAPARLLLDGWSLSNIDTFASGQPITGMISGYPSNGVDGGVTGGLVSNAASATGGRIPQVGRNTFAGPSLYNVDLRLARAFTFRERYQLQLRGEAFNLFNHTNIASLNTTAFNYVKVGATGCPSAVASSTNGCLVPSPTFLAPTSSTSTNGLYGARQLQISARFVF
jgi:hypothetical protein